VLFAEYHPDFTTPGVTVSGKLTLIKGTSMSMNRVVKNSRYMLYLSVITVLLSFSVIVPVMAQDADRYAENVLEK